jgi:cytochrome P450
MVRMTLAVIARSLFSVRLSGADVRVISDGISAIQAFMVRQIVHPYLRGWFAVSGELARHHAIRAQGDKILARIIDERRSEMPLNDDFLQLLLDAGPGDIGHSFTRQQVLDESMQMLVAGHETSSNVLTWLLYLLSRDSDWLELVRKELHNVLRSEPLGTRHLPNLPLTTAVVQEAMRLFPPFWMIDRTAVADDRVGGFAVPAGTTIIAFIYGAHRDPSRWSRPECFVPDRFRGSARELRNTFDYLPFGAGPRTCIGFNYAMLQMTLILSVILARYRFELTDEALVESRAMITLRPKSAIRMRFQRLQ